MAWTAAVLSVVFGLGWGFGLAQTSVPKDSGTAAEVTLFILQLLFGLLVGSQGVLVFIFYGVGNHKVRVVWKRWFLGRTHTKVYARYHNQPAALGMSNDTFPSTTMQSNTSGKETLQEKKQEFKLVLTVISD